MLCSHDHLHTAIYLYSSSKLFVLLLIVLLFYLNSCLDRVILSFSVHNLNLRCYDLLITQKDSMEWEVERSGKELEDQIEYTGCPLGSARFRGLGCICR